MANFTYENAQLDVESIGSTHRLMIHNAEVTIPGVQLDWSPRLVEMEAAAARVEAALIHAWDAFEDGETDDPALSEDALRAIAEGPEGL